MKGIAFKLWKYIIALMIIILGILWILQTKLVSDFYISRQADSLIMQAKKIINEYDINDIAIQKNIEAMSSNNSAVINIYDNSGSIIFTAGKLMKGVITSIEAASLKDVLSGKEIVLNDTKSMTGVQVLTIGIPIKYNSTIKGAIFIHTPFSSIEETLYIIKKQFLLITIIAVIIATLGAFFISKKFTEPILKINAAALQISKGEYNTALNLKCNDEIGKLACTINNMSAELSKIENLRRDFIANISHEFKTPLGIIRSYGEGILDEVYKDEAEKKEYINVMLDETNRLTNLINDILDLSKLQSGNVSIRMEKFSITELINRVNNKFKVICEKNRINIIVDIHENIYVYGDEARIEQVLINIINNSLNHTHEGGKIIIGNKVDEDVIIEIKDTGDGIAQKDLPYIFDRFYKVQNKDNFNKSGTGIGLSIVKEILSAHNSSFGIDSEINIGTKFYFSLKKAV